MDAIAVYGKGGIGKTVVATNLSVYYAMQGKKVLHVGCDPKHDSAIRLLSDGAGLRTVLDVLHDRADEPDLDEFIVTGRYGIHCCESGGPLPGLGCGGRGVARVIETLDELGVLQSGNYDVAVFDVLGDVVCGGFAAPLREGFAKKVVIVLSEEPMSWFAANNIARAIDIYKENGVALAGLVVNLRSNDAPREPLERFAKKLNTRILAFVERDYRIIEGERKRQTIIEYAPDIPAARMLRRLAEELHQLDPDSLPLPTPMNDEEFFRFLETYE